MNLLKVDALEEALRKLESEIIESSQKMLQTCEIEVAASYGKVLAEDIYSEENIPGFDRSTVDGYAVFSADVSGAGENIPSFLRYIGEVRMGEEAQTGLERGCCVYVPTGAMLPAGADAVVMAEHCQPFGEDMIAVYSSLSAGTNVVFEGDDIKKGEKILSCGRRLKPADMGMLSAVGRTSVKTMRPWRVYIVSTGDELVAAGADLGRGQVRDVNTYGLIGEAQALGFEVSGCDMIADDKESIKERIQAHMEDCDFIVISGGSSKGKKDETADIIEELSSEGVMTHGLAVKPGKPTIIGFDRPAGCALLGLPGHPAAALMIFEQVAGTIWRRLCGCTEAEKDVSVECIMKHNIPSSPGRKTFQLVRIDFINRDEASGLPHAEVVYGLSGMISSLSRADGYIITDINDEGINSGSRVRVRLLAR